MSQEIETTLDESSVTAGAKPADPMPKLGADGSSLAGVQDLGGPTPQNSKPTDDSNKYKTVAGGNAAAPTTKPSDASGGKAEFAAKGDVKAGHEPEGDVIAEEPQETVIEVDLSADVAALTEGEELTEEFKEKAKTIFEAAVVSRINEELERMHEDYAKVLEEEIESVKSDLAENVELNKSVGTYIKNGIVTEIAEGLSLAQREKIVSLAEAVEFENEESFRAKVSTLRESYFSTKPEVTTVTEDVQVENGPVGDAMAAYAQAISRWNK
jgi:hypothetical protein